MGATDPTVSHRPAGPRPILALVLVVLCLVGPAPAGIAAAGAAPGEEAVAALVNTVETQRRVVARVRLALRAAVSAALPAARHRAGARWGGDARRRGPPRRGPPATTA